MWGCVVGGVGGVECDMWVGGVLCCVCVFFFLMIRGTPRFKFFFFKKKKTTGIYTFTLHNALPIWVAKKQKKNRKKKEDKSKKAIYN